MRPGSNKQAHVAGGILAAILTLGGLSARPAQAIDFYEIQIYTTATAPLHHLVLELHSNSVVSASGDEAKAQLMPHQVHETVEATYGVTPHIEIGQYFCTVILDNGNYEYAGSRTKLHFGIAATDDWPVHFGGNIELDYMRHAAEENPLSLELRPIVETRFRKFTLVANFAFEKPFSGPGTHKGMTLAPSGEVTYDLVHWLTPALEYYGDLGPSLTGLPSLRNQQHFIVPALNFNFLPQLELNAGAGFGLTRASNGIFLKAIVGWEF